MATVALKFPGLSAILVLGMSIGLLLNKDFANAAVTFLIAASDCFRFKRATQKGKP